MTLLVAVHAQPSAVRTSKLPDSPPAGTDANVVASETLHPCPWLTVNVCPAIVIDPERPGPVVEATVKLTVPFPLPLEPDVMVIHGCALAAVQAQPAPAVTLTEPLPPEGATDWESGEMANVHPSPCVIVTVCPATVTVPEREGPESGATLSVTVPDPVPFAPDVTVIQSALLAAVHGHPADDVIVRVRVPPDAATE